MRLLKKRPLFLATYTQKQIFFNILVHQQVAKGTTDLFQLK